MLQINSLAFDYPDTPLLKNVQLSVVDGRLLCLRGGNGVGKTTLLKLLAGLLYPSEGEILWDNISIYNNLPAYQRNLCFVGHKTGLNHLLTVKENCYFNCYWQSGWVDNSYFLTVLERFDLAGLEDKPCYQLSEGQRRRVALLRLAMTSARIWLLDEPLTALDKTSIMLLTTCLTQHLATNGLVVMTSHQDLLITDYEEYCL